jgi:hypothetical protein
MKSKLSAALAATVCILAVSVVAAEADTIYTYTGMTFGSVSGAYTKNDRITGSFDLATPLGNNIPDHVISPVSFSFSDGVQTITNTTPGIDAFFSVGTDPSGQPNQWTICLNQLAFGDCRVDDPLHIETLDTLTHVPNDFAGSPSPPVPHLIPLPQVLGLSPLPPCPWTNHRVRSPWPDLGERWPSRLVATAAEDRLSIRQQRVPSNEK